MKTTGIVKTRAEAEELAAAYDPGRDPRVFQAEAKHWREGVEFAAELANARLSEVQREGIRDPAALVSILHEIATRLNDRLEKCQEALPKVKAAAVENFRKLVHTEAANFQQDARIEAIQRETDAMIKASEDARAKRLAAANAERLQALEEEAKQAQAKLNAARQSCGLSR